MRPGAGELALAGRWSSAKTATRNMAFVIRRLDWGSVAVFTVMQPWLSIETHECATENLRKDLDQFWCVVLNLDLLFLWPEIRVSPFGIADKASVGPKLSGHMINDLSFPVGSSINKCIGQESIDRPEFIHCHKIAEEVLRLQGTPALEEDAADGIDVFLIGGDMSSAFCNVSIHSSSVHLVCGTIEEENALIEEISAPFGCAGFSCFYKVYGSAISRIYGNAVTKSVTDGFFNYHWVDDHINVAQKIGSQLPNAERSLRFAMIPVQIYGYQRGQAYRLAYAAQGSQPVI